MTQSKAWLWVVLLVAIAVAAAIYKAKITAGTAPAGEK